MEKLLSEMKVENKYKYLTIRKEDLDIGTE